MLNAIDVECGRLIFDVDGELAGQLLITNDGKTRQLHTENFNLSSIKAVRAGREFLKDKHNILSGCKKNNIKLIKLMKLLQFKEVGECDDYLAFLKE